MRASLIHQTIQAMKIAVIQFPGSNCERETHLALQRNNMQSYDVLWCNKQVDLNEFDGFVIVGGFSYEDRVRAGLIATKDPLIDKLKLQADMGKPVLGICNGAQILLETGLVPGIADNRIMLALANNQRIANNQVIATGYYNAWVHIKPMTLRKHQAFTHNITNDSILKMPISHAEGCFVTDENIMQALRKSSATLWQYCDDKGNTDNNFPTNPNGSIHSLAAISNLAGNVLAIMPHPERTQLADSSLFASMHQHIKNGSSIDIADTQKQNEAINSIKLQHSKNLIKQHVANDNINFIVKLVITDNEAVSLQKACSKIGIQVNIQKYSYWDISVTNNDKTTRETTTQKIIKTAEIYNNNKEVMFDDFNKITNSTENSKIFLVHDKANIAGKEKLNSLHRGYDLRDIKEIKFATAWKITPVNPDDDIAELTDAIHKNHLLFNQFQHDCFVV
ncbi:MAG: phosphoribosylformylglycinamidine synthase I [Thiotrichales bacterium]|nr:MAG: phosphoribosylformylglycinamidine synthase I [Thiotrichales bacterium]